MTTLTDKFASEIALTNDYLEKLIPPEQDLAELNLMAKSCRYSVNSTGKRFRAILSLLTARALGHELNLVIPYAAAVELIHTYSLIHDDLPCMDDDDYRRGQPSHHKVFGEAMAVISGDALQTLAFELIAESYQQMPKLGMRSLAILAKASGYQGMVGGQGIDLSIAQGLKVELETVKVLHKLKTGKLIQAATEGAAVLCEASEKQVQLFADFGETLGLAFQVADDILDHEDSRPELMGLPRHIGLEETKTLLAELSEKATKQIKEFGETSQDLQFIVEFNHNRTQH